MARAGDSSCHRVPASLIMKPSLTGRRAVRERQSPLKTNAMADQEPEKRRSLTWIEILVILVIVAVLVVVTVPFFQG